MQCCSRAENSSTVILKNNMFSMIYNVWSWYDVKITQNYLIVLFLINIYSQDYNYTLKYSYGHYMVFVVSITIFSVLQFLFCLQLFIFWLIIYNYSVYFTSSNIKISIFWEWFLEDFFTGYGPYRFLIETFFGLWNTNKQNFNPISYWNGFFINLLYLMSGKHNFFVWN
jgi:hypothetical protein